MSSGRSLIVMATVLMAAAAAAQTNTFPASGNVGIGTTSPAYTLTVNGIMGDNGEFILNNSIGQWRLSSLSLGYDTAAQEGWLQVGSSTTSGPLSLNAQGGKVGVGTTAPQTALEVDGPASLNIQNVLGVFNPLVSTQAHNNGAAIIMGHDGGAYFAKIATIFESQNPDYLRPALAFFTMGSSYLAGSEVERMRISSGGNVGIGTTNPGKQLEVNGSIALSSGSGGSITFQDGTTQSTAYTGVTCGGDYAESVDVTGNRTKYEPGDVLVIDPSAPGKFLKANQPYSTLVAGIYSTKPGTVGRRQLTPKSSDEVPMAMMGIVPTKVTTENGPIKTGDLLVASSTPGRAMKGTDRTLLTGAVLGKALGSLDKGAGVIEVLVTLQ